LSSAVSPSGPQLLSIPHPLLWPQAALPPQLSQYQRPPQPQAIIRHLHPSPKETTQLT
jgi:hypothetical protein